MAQRRSKDTRVAILIGPDTNFFVSFFAVLGGSQWRGGRPNFLNPIQLASRIRPAGPEPLHDRMVSGPIEHFMCVMCSMASRGDATEFEPLICTIAIAVHGAVHDHRRNALLMRFQNTPGPSWIGNIGKTLVMNHDVVTICPVGVFIERDAGIGGLASLLNDIDHNPRSLLQAVLDQLFLR